MSYYRVIPRDLFNEGNLLKCLGQVYLQLEYLNLPDVSLAHASSRYGFPIEQDQNDGSITVTNVMLSKDGELYSFRRPLNSREPYPLWLVHPDDEDIAVFNDDGTFTEEMLAFLRGSEAP